MGKIYCDKSLVQARKKRKSISKWIEGCFKKGQKLKNFESKAKQIKQTATLDMKFDLIFKM